MTEEPCARRTTAMLTVTLTYREPGHRWLGTVQMAVYEGAVAVNVLRQSTELGPFASSTDMAAWAWDELRRVHALPDLKSTLDIPPHTTESAPDQQGDRARPQG